MAGEIRLKLNDFRGEGGLVGKYDFELSVNITMVFIRKSTKKRGEDKNSN